MRMPSQVTGGDRIPNQWPPSGARSGATSPPLWLQQVHGNTVAIVDEFYRRLEEEGDVPWEEWLEKTEAIRARVARFVGAEADEVTFVPNTSTGINLIADLLADDGPVLAVEGEFPTITLPWIHRGVDVRSE